MATGKYTIADIELQTPIQHGSILALEITSGQGEHGKLTITMEAEESMAAGSTEGYIDSEIRVSIKGGQQIFAGVCKDIALSNQASYKTLQITAYTASINMDKEAKKATYQNPAKTLKEVADKIASAYGADIQLDEACPISEVLYQQNETDFAFLKRVAASKGKTVFVDTAAASPQLYIGKLGFRSYGKEVLGESLGSSRDVGEMERAKAAGQMAEGYMYDTYDCYCTAIEASAGDKIDDVRVVKAGKIFLNKGILENRITHAYEEGIHPTQAESTQPSLNKGVLTGKVSSVSGNQIQVALDTDGGAGEMVWVPYESCISNSFYCMPDEGDSVYLYYENSGNLVCLGSRHTNTDSPDFDKPKENVLTNHNKMIKLGEKKVTLSATRDLTDEANPSEVSIIMDDEAGITIQSGRSILMEARENLNFFTGNVEGYTTQYEEGKAQLESRHSENEAIYKAESGIPDLGDYAADVLTSTLKKQAKNFLDMGKGMVMYDLWAGLFNKDENETEEGPQPVENGVATLYGYQTLVLQVDKNTIILDENVNITAETFKWLGYEQGTHSPQEKPLQDWWETILDGVQFALDIAGCIPVFGAVPDLINAGVSLMRGNFAEAAMSAVAAIPFAGDAVGAVKIAGKGAKLVTKALSKAERVMSVLQGLYVSAQAAFAIYQMKDQLADMWKRFKDGENIFANPADVSMLFNLAGSGMMALRGAKGMGEGIAGKKLEISGGKTPKGGDSTPSKPKTGIKDKVKGVGEKLMNLLTGGDPVNVVTGSFLMQYRDLQLRDTGEIFYLTRTFESVYENPGRMLGRKWFLSIETRLSIDENNITLQLPDMNLIEFTRTEYGWENKKGNDRSYQLQETREGYRLICHPEKKTCYYSQEGKIQEITDKNGNTTRFWYENNYLTKITLASGQFLTFVYKNNLLDTLTMTDGRTIHYQYEGDLLTKITYQNNSSTCYEYDKEGNIHTVIDQMGRRYVTNEYDRKGRVVRQILADGSEYVMFYNDRERKNTFTSLATGEKTEYEYNREQVVTKVIYADGTTVEYGYDERENRIYEKDRNGNETQRTYDIFGNILEEKQPSGLITTTEYDVYQNKLRQYDNAGGEVIWEYDEKGNIIAEKMLLEKGKWCQMYFTYDSMGRLLTLTNPRGNQIQYEYETRFSEPTAKLEPEGTKTRYSYDEAGRCMIEKTSKGEKRYTYNRTDCVTQIKNEEGIILRYNYDLAGKQTGIIRNCTGKSSDAELKIYYDRLDNLTGVITPEGNVYDYKIRSDGNVVKAIHPNTYNENTKDGEGMTFDYDETGRRIRTRYPDGGCERYFLDGNENIIKKIAPEQYDEKTDDGAGYTYEYDSADRLTKITDPYGNVQQVYIYDLTDNVIKSIDARGYLTADNDDDRIGTHYTYNLAGWMTSKREPLRKNEEGKICYKLTCYRYDDMGNLIEEKRYLDEQTLDSRQGRIHTISYTYDKANRLTEITDSTGAAIRYSYDEAGYPVSEKVRVSEEAWKETRYEYSPAGKLIKQMVRLKEELEQEQTLYTKSRIKESDWAITEFTYDSFNNVSKVKMPEGGCYYYEYDKDDRLIRERHVEEGGEIANEITYRYDKNGNRTAVTDVNGSTTEYEYDLRDRNISVHSPDGGRSRSVFDKNGNLIRRYTPMQTAGMFDESKMSAGSVESFFEKQEHWKYIYDANNRMTEIIAPNGNLLNSLTYEADGQLKTTADALGSGINITYDLAGRRTFAKTSGGSTQSYHYDAHGNIIGLTDGLSNRTEFILDSWGRITGIKKPDGTEEQYTYDYMGNMLTTQDGAGNIVSFRYDLNGNMTTRIDQMGNRELFGYDKENRLVSMIDRNGTNTRITYNMYGSMTNRTATTADQSSIVTESYGYYPDGKLRFAIGGGMRYDYIYDVMGRLSQKNASGRTLLSNEYDLNGNRIAMTDLTGKRCEYRYNSLEQLEEIIDNGTRQVRYSYNADGTVSRMEVGTGLVTEYTYDADKNVISQKTVLAGADAFLGASALQNANSLQKEVQGTENLPSILAMNQRDRNKPFTLVDNTYSYDTNGNRTSKQTLAGLITYHYDATERLVKVNYPMGSEEYHYDKAGNRTAKLINGIEAERYQYDARNRLVSQDVLSLRADGANTPEHKENTYDEQGNMLSDGRRNFTYDAMNRLSQVTTTEGNIQKNRYDGEGLRAEMEENGRLVSFLFDGQKMVAETDCDQNTIRYIRGYELISSDSEKAKTYYHYASDEMGSITHITDEAGNVCNHYEYDAFGDFTVKEETTQNRFGFTGEQYDPIAGLYYLRARFYNPVIGRFIQEDTYYGDGLNLYGYCANNPVRYIDPSGNKKECPIVTDISSQLKKAGFSDADIMKLKDDLKGRWKKTKQGLLDKINEANGDMKKMQDILDEFYNKKPSQDSQILSRNLVKYLKEKGIPVPTFPKAAHHIVAIHADAAEATRKLLKKYGIGDDELNSAANGVFLPTDPLQNPNGSTLHIGSHKESYHLQVYEYISTGIKDMEAKGIKVQANDIYGLIDDIRQELVNGNLKLN